MTSMSADRFLDRFRFFSAEMQQIHAVGQLYEVIRSSDQGAAILDEQAPWAVSYSSKPPAPPTPEALLPAPAGGLDPRGSEEAGMAGPQKPAPVKPGDSYLLVNDRDEDMEAYDHTGQFLWKLPCLARGLGSAAAATSHLGLHPHPQRRSARQGAAPLPPGHGLCGGVSGKKVTAGLVLQPAGA